VALAAVELEFPDFASRSSYTELSHSKLTLRYKFTTPAGKISRKHALSVDVTPPEITKMSEPKGQDVKCEAETPITVHVTDPQASGQSFQMITGSLQGNIYNNHTIITLDRSHASYIKEHSGLIPTPEPTDNITRPPVIPRSAPAGTTHVQSEQAAEPPAGPYLEEAERSLHRACAAYDAGQWSEAVVLFQRGFEWRRQTMPDSAETACNWNKYGRALYNSQQYEQAINCFQSSLQWAEKKHGPNSDTVLKLRLCLARALKGSGQLFAAVEEYRCARERWDAPQADPTDCYHIQCVHELGQLLAFQREPYDRSWRYWGEAKECLQRAMKDYYRMDANKPEALEAHVDFAAVLLMMCEDKKARAQFEELRKIANMKGLQKGDIIRERIEWGLKESKYWMRQPAAKRNGDRCPKAREREAERQRLKELLRP
jgi:tetratricopeptide (TPR) repeat protein